jgi:hypothetical protein
MTISNFRAAEPLYIVIVRDHDAEKKLKIWAREANCQVTIESNRMKIFEQRSLSMLQMSWSHGWDNVTIWDTWNKRHIHTD